MHRYQHSFKKFLQIYELFGYDTPVSKKFPTLASPRLYLVKFFQIYYGIPPKFTITLAQVSNVCRPIISALRSLLRLLRDPAVGGVPAGENLIKF